MNPSRVTRIDVGRLGKFRRTPTGGIRIPASLTRVGVLSYETADGQTVRELRSPDEVFDPASIASFEDGAVTDLHPEANVDASNWSELAVGHVRNVHRDGEFLAGDVLVQDAAEIALIERGDRVEVSSGYTCELDPTPGVFNGEPYDVIQRGIRYNHAGLGPAGWGRAGREVALRLDAGHEIIGAPTPPTKRRSESMPTVRIDGIDHEVGSTSHLQALDRRSSVLESERDELRGRLDSATEQVATLTKERDAARADAKSASSQENIDAAVSARLAIVDRARRALGAEFDGAGMSDGEVMVAALDAKGVKLDEEAAANSDYVRGRFEAVTDAVEEPEGDEGDDLGEERGDSRTKPRARTSTRVVDKADPVGLPKVRQDNAKWHAEAPSRFALSK